MVYVVITHCASAVAEVAIINQSGAQLKHALELQVLHKPLVNSALLTGWQSTLFQCKSMGGQAVGPQTD